MEPYGGAAVEQKDSTSQANAADEKQAAGCLTQGVGLGAATLVFVIVVYAGFMLVMMPMMPTTTFETAEDVAAISAVTGSQTFEALSCGLLLVAGALAAGARAGVLALFKQAANGKKEG